MTMDFFPTFAKLAGVAPPEGHQIDGIDIMPLLTGDAKNVHDRPLHWLFADSWAARKGPWKLIGKGRKAHELVNLQKDIEETNNNLDEQPEIANELMKLHLQWIDSVGNK